MSVRPLEAPRFVRRTQLGANEYRKNFRQIDGDVISAVTSAEADRVTPLMSKIYLRLLHAPVEYREREGVLRFEAELRGDKHVKAWDVLCEGLGVSSATARKALLWMHEQGIIGYFAGKNGVGIRIFLNRATSSIGSRAAGQKILEFSHASSGEPRASRNEAAFNDSFAVVEVLDTDLSPCAPKSGAESTQGVKKVPGLMAASSCSFPHLSGGGEKRPSVLPEVGVPVADIVSRLKRELEPALRLAARQAASEEHERTREWLESRGLPKAARVAQREAFNVLRKHGVIRGAAQSSYADVGGGCPVQDEHSQGRRPLSDDEVEELAQACIAMLEVKAQPVELTLRQMSAEDGGFLLPDDSTRVRTRVEALLDSPHGGDVT